MSQLDRAVGFDLLIRYLDNGDWGDTGLAALEARAEKIAAGTDIELGELSLYEPADIPPYTSTLDASD
jgi:hypothetical protein